MTQYIDWIKVDEYLERNLPAILPVRPGSKIALVVGADRSVLILRVPVGRGDPLPAGAPRELSFAMATVRGADVLEVTTSTAELFAPFYHFAIGVAVLIERDGLPPVVAVETALSQFGELSAQRALLSDEVLLGMRGELQLLQALLKARGLRAFASWLGPLGERHDFRLGKNEIEVKSTRGTTRKHLIHGLEQLQATPGKALYLLSLRYQRAGEGRGCSMPKLVESVRKTLPAGGSQREAFEKRLSSLGYRKKDEPHYQEAFELAAPPVLVLIDRDTPRITAEVLKEALNKKQLGRIASVQYEINVDGLGCEEGSAEFEGILPNLKLEDNK